MNTGGEKVDIDTNIGNKTPNHAKSAKSEKGLTTYPPTNPGGYGKDAYGKGSNKKGKM